MRCKLFVFFVHSVDLWSCGCAFGDLLSFLCGLDHVQKWKIVRSVTMSVMDVWDPLICFRFLHDWKGSVCSWKSQIAKSFAKRSIATFKRAGGDAFLNQSTIEIIIILGRSEWWGEPETLQERGVQTRRSREDPVRI